ASTARSARPCAACDSTRSTASASVSLSSRRMRGEDPGPAGFSGSLVVAEFPSLEDARAWADADPYVAAGVYARVEVRPFRKVLP
ncbi:MAG: YciI family protein, partial [Thermomonas sp.]